MEGWRSANSLHEQSCIILVKVVFAPLPAQSNKLTYQTLILTMGTMKCTPSQHLRKQINKTETTTMKQLKTLKSLHVGYGNSLLWHHTLVEKPCNRGFTRLSPGPPDDKLPRHSKNPVVLLVKALFCSGPAKEHCLSQRTP